MFILGAVVSDEGGAGYCVLAVVVNEYVAEDTLLTLLLRTAIA